MLNRSRASSIKSKLLEMAFKLESPQQQEVHKASYVTTEQVGLRWLTFVTHMLVKEENVNGNEARAEGEDDDDEEDDGEGEGEGCKY